MRSCFVVCPIGASGTEIRENSDDLRDLIIKPALEPLGFEIIRGDHRSEAGQIDVDVIRAVQESDLCIVDISIPNPNVFYELGRRDETGKPLILLKSKNSDDLPVDIATRRYIEYDLDSRHGIRDAVIQLKNFIEPIVKKGFESTGTGASLFELAEILKRIERKIDRMEDKTSSSNTGGLASIPDADDVDPIDLLGLSLRQRNIPMAERAMGMLQFRMSKQRWLDQVVEQVAAIGSIKAGRLLIENAQEFMDNSNSFREKVEYLGCLVSNLNRNDSELDNLELVENLCTSLSSISGEEPVEDQVQIYNQLNRLYHGIFAETDDVTWLEKAIDVLNQAIKIADYLGYLWYNLAICLRDRDRPHDKELALQYAMRCIELDGNKLDDDHIEMACKLMYALDDPRLSDYLSMLEKANPIKAKLLQSRLKK